MASHSARLEVLACVVHKQLKISTSLSGFRWSGKTRAPFFFFFFFFFAPVQSLGRDEFAGEHLLDFGQRWCRTHRAQARAADGGGGVGEPQHMSVAHPASRP